MKKKYLKLAAYAKINLGLEILGKNNNNLHNLNMITQSVNLCDYIILEESKEIKISCDKNVCPENRNLVYVALNIFYQEFNIKNFGINIKIKKNIPVQAGLGGGSSDAAAVLFGLNKIFDNIASKEKLISLAFKIGSDVPICLLGGCLEFSCNKILNINNIPDCKILIIKPNFGNDTAFAYSKSDEIFKKNINSSKIKELKKNIKSGDIKKIFKSCFNNFEKVFGRQKNFRLTGSGSAYYKIFENIEKNLKIYNIILNFIDNENFDDFEFFICKPVESGVKIIENSWN
jgi:4-diphosphocytidyl-2-C-methyl-D-erythritol kinase